MANIALLVLGRTPSPGRNTALSRGNFCGVILGSRLGLPTLVLCEADIAVWALFILFFLLFLFSSRSVGPERFWVGSGRGLASNGLLVSWQLVEAQAQRHAPDG